MSTTQIKTNRTRTLRSAIVNEDGAIDLASILVGVVVLGLIGTIIAAVVFAVIPWAQDNAAKEQLRSLRQAQNVYSGLAADTSTVVSGALASPTAAASNTRANYGTLAQLKEQKLFDGEALMRMALGETSNCYTATIESGSGKVYWTDSGTGDIELYSNQANSTCRTVEAFPDLADFAPEAESAISKFTINCPAGVTTAALPIREFTGTVDWGTGAGPVTAGPGHPQMTVTPGVTYNVIVNGTFTRMTSETMPYRANDCLRGMPEWGGGSGTTDASSAFARAANFTVAPAQIPSTVTNVSSMFFANTVFNDPTVSSWDVSNVNSFADMFAYTSFNQPLNSWNMQNAQDISTMFANNTKFNQPLGSWNTSNVTNMHGVFTYASSFNQPIGIWKTGNVQSMNAMFSGTKFNQDISNWDTGNVTDLTEMFFANTAFNQPVGKWNTAKVEHLDSVFSGATSFNQPLNSWNVANVKTMSSVFTSSAYNYSLSSWKTGNVTDMRAMFSYNKSFNQDLSMWDTKNVTSMNYMFSNSTAFKQDLSGWNVGKVTSSVDFNLKGQLTAAQLPKFA